MVVVVVVVTISEVEARKKRRYKRENFGGTGEGPTQARGMEPDTDETRGTEPDILATTISPMIPMNQADPLRLSIESLHVSRFLRRWPCSVQEYVLAEHQPPVECMVRSKTTGLWYYWDPIQKKAQWHPFWRLNAFHGDAVFNHVLRITKMPSRLRACPRLWKRSLRNLQECSHFKDHHRICSNPNCETQRSDKDTN